MNNTTVFTTEESARLLLMNENLHQEADACLLESGFGNIITAAGFCAVGSYAMGTMTWRDLDFERTSEEPSWADHWALGKALSETGWGWRLCCIDAYRDPRSPGERGYYWGVRACSPQGGPTWKLDVWTARPHEFDPDGRRAGWMGALNDESRVHILAIKETVCKHPSYRDTLLSIHIYEAVLEHGVRSIDAFWAWWHDRKGCSP